MRFNPQGSRKVNIALLFIVVLVALGALYLNIRHYEEFAKYRRGVLHVQNCIKEGVCPRN